MVLLYTPELDLGKRMPDFNLQGIDNENWNLSKCMGKKGLVVMFICNHCPYVKSIQDRLVEDANKMKEFGINTVAIMSNDVDDYPEDSFENMQKIAKEKNYSFPYLLDNTQETAQNYGAICTPDIFGLDSKGQLHYRGRLDSAGRDIITKELPRDLVNAMHELAEKGKITSQQIPSMGCSIKWKND